MKTMQQADVLTRLIEPKDVGTNDVTSSYVDVSDCERFRVIASAGAVTAAKILTVQLMQAKDTSGTDAKVLGDAVAKAGAGGNAPAVVDIETLTQKLDHKNGFTCVAVTLGIDENGKLGTAYLLRGHRRYEP